MRLSERYAGVLSYFLENVGEAASELNYSSEYELLVSVMLSAQCTDKRVNMVTPALFAAFPDPAALAGATLDEVLPLVKSVSYPNSKAAHLIAAAKKIVVDFGGEVPRSIEDLMTLPGVGRKTANVVTSIVWGEPVIAVDTHVFRVSHRLGLSSGKNPLAVEKDLERHIPLELRSRAHHWLLLHGRYICTASRPKCGSCPLSSWCRCFADSSRRSSDSTSASRL